MLLICQSVDQSKYRYTLYMYIISSLYVLESYHIVSSPMMGIHFLGGGFKHVLCSPLLGEDSHFD